MLHDIDVVALPEAIHLTHEFPVVRKLPLPTLLILGSMHYRAALTVAASLLLVLIFSGLVWRWRKHEHR